MQRWQLLHPSKMLLRSRLRIRVLNCLRLVAEQQNNAPSPKTNNAVAGYQGPVKIELLKDAGLRQ